jgi:hypothetical protein
MDSIFESHAKESAMTVAQIRNLFLNARPIYSPVEAAEAIGMSVEDVRGWMEVGELEGVEC